MLTCAIIIGITLVVACAAMAILVIIQETRQLALRMHARITSQPRGQEALLWR